jgi:hypothetical protein
VEDPKLKRWLLAPGGLVERLRQLQGNVKGVVFAERAGMVPSKLSKLRLGQQMPTDDDVRDWVRAAGASPEEEQELLAMLADGHAKNFASSLHQGQEAHQHTYNELVEQSDVVRMIERSFVPSVMQTRDYATAVFVASAKLHKTVRDDIEATVAARMERQKYLYDERYRFEFVIDETVLTRRIAPPEVMYAQCDRILGFMDRPNLRLGILPVYGDYHDVVRNSFELYGEIGVIETYYDDATMDSEEWAAHVDAMRDIWQDAVEGDEARKIIRDAMKHHAQGMKTRKGRDR